MREFQAVFLSLRDCFFHHQVRRAPLLTSASLFSGHFYLSPPSLPSRGGPTVLRLGWPATLFPPRLTL